MLGRMALWWFRWRGWTIEGSLPPEQKFVAIGAPHTSNWDFLLMLAAMASFGVKVSFMGKDALFGGPMGVVMSRLGGIPIRRGTRASVVEQMADAFATADSLILVIAPSGTRGYSDHWKSGFYYIARSAGVPIVPARIHYPQKLITMGEPLRTTGDLTADMDVLRDFFRLGRGKRADQASLVRLREENGEPSGSPPR